MTMRIAVASLVLLLGMASRSDAQVVVSGNTWNGTPIVWATDSYGPPIVTSPGQLGPYSLAPYSYYVTLPYPARGYLGYGSNDFPYYGRPYGSPSDPWTWPYMSTAFNSGLARYYYPPVR